MRSLKTEEDLREFIQHGHRVYIPGITVDCVIFGYHERQLKVLLGCLKGLNQFALPGGYVRKDERLSDAAKRLLEERTALDNLYLEQFHTFGDSPIRANKVRVHEAVSGTWLEERTLTIGYFALVEFSKVVPVPDYLTDHYAWYDIKSLPPLLFDHNEMVAKALEHLKINIYHTPIGINLLEKKFTLPEIQSLYETILERKLDRRNFPKKLLSLGLIKDTNEVRKIGQHRSPKLYSFDRKNYNKALKDGIVLAL